MIHFRLTVYAYLHTGQLAMHYEGALVAMRTTNRATLEQMVATDDPSIRIRRDILAKLYPGALIICKITQE